MINNPTNQSTIVPRSPLHHAINSQFGETPSELLLHIVIDNEETTSTGSLAGK
jgi:hypothetical protein